MATVPDMYTCRSNGRRYLSLLHLRDKKVNPPFFSGCGNVGVNVRPCVKKNAIPERSMIWVSSTGVSNETNKRAQPFVTEEYAHEWIMNTERIVEYRRGIRAQASAEKARAIAEKRVARKRYDPAQLEPLPDPIELVAPFFDEHGTMLDIEMRGERTVKGIVFKALDVQKAFGTERINDAITDGTSAFEYGIHYKFYSGTKNSGTRSEKNTISEPENTISEPENTPNSGNGTDKKVLYLTYIGLIKYLFGSRSAKVDAFQQWAIERLFVHQFGDQAEKDKLAGELVKETHSTVANLFRRSYLSIPCIYLMRIGKRSNVDAYFEGDPNAPDLSRFDDNDYVYKLGLTNSLARRYEEHVLSYGKWSPHEFQIARYLYVDEVYLRKAETYFKELMRKHSVLVNCKKFKELVVIPEMHFKNMNDCFEDMSIKFSSQSEKLAMYRELESNDFEMQKERSASRICELETALEHQKIETAHVVEMQKERSASRICEIETALEHQKIEAAHVVEKLELKLANVEAMRAMDREMCELKLFKATTL